VKEKEKDMDQELVGRLQSIAALVKTFPTTFPTVHFAALDPAGGQAIALLADVPNARLSATLYGGEEPHVIESIEADVDGVRFVAQHRRAPSADERARLTEAREVAPACLALTL
jgi:hypothetical protein